MEKQTVPESVLLDLLAEAPSCLVDTVVRMYPDLPDKTARTEEESLVRRIGCLELCE
jgi:hypothetical protein